MLRWTAEGNCTVSLSAEPIQWSGFSPGTFNRVMIIPLLGCFVEKERS
jgi:fumarate reductase subunit D